MLVQVNEVQYQQIFRDLIQHNYQDNHYFGIITSPIAVHESRNKDYNANYCGEHNIPILYSDREGGTIVTFAGDVAFFYIQNENKVPKEIEYILQYLRKTKGLNAVLDYAPNLIGRDILIDDTYKVVTFTNSVYGNVVFTAGHISINVDLDEIRNICTKPMKKIPKGLSDYGITTEDIVSLIRQANK